VDFIHVAQDTNLQGAPVSMVINRRVSQRGIIRTEINFWLMELVAVLSFFFFLMFDYVTTWLFMIHSLTQSEDLVRQKTKCINSHLILNSLCN